MTIRLQAGAVVLALSTQPWAQKMLADTDGLAAIDTLYFIVLMVVEQLNLKATN